MSHIKYPTPFLKNRRVSLGLTQMQVAAAIGIEQWAMQKLEQRGELPEIHFEKLSQVLQVSVLELQIEKYAPIIREIFHIPTESFRSWVNTNVDTDRAFGRKPPKISMIDSLDDPRVPPLFKQVIREARAMTPEEGFEDLKKSGIYTPGGKLAPEYGGPKKE